MTNEMTPEEAIKVFKSELDWAKQNRYPYVNENKIKAIKLVIQALESQRWIPVSERLPKPNEIVLVTIKRWGHYDNDLFENLPEYTYSTSFTCYNPHFGFNDDVIAWMPLPAPYKSESEE